MVFGFLLVPGNYRLFWPACRLLHLKARFARRDAWLTAALLAGAAVPVQAQPPWATTQAAGPVAPTAATLNGMATARGYPTAAWFEWGSDGSYGQVTTLTNIGISG
jgi:hypothetical protein